MFRFTKPDAKSLHKLIEKHQNAPLSYTNPPSPDYDHDDNRILLGQGQTVFDAAKQALAEWRMFPKGWTMLYRPQETFTEGMTLAMCARIWGIWWVNLTRIVRVVDDARHFGFAYGTLAHHVEKGEELFRVKMDASGGVWYEISAFSKPNYWMVRWTYPLARIFQKRFAQESMQSIKQRTHEILKSQPQCV